MTLPDGATVRSGDADAAERLSALTGRRLTLWPRQPAERADHYRRGLPGRSRHGRASCARSSAACPTNRCPICRSLPPELFEYTSPLGTYFDLAPMHLLTTASLRDPGGAHTRRRTSTAAASGPTC